MPKRKLTVLAADSEAKSDSDAADKENAPVKKKRRRVSEKTKRSLSKTATTEATLKSKESMKSTTTTEPHSSAACTSRGLSDASSNPGVTKKTKVAKLEVFLFGNKPFTEVLPSECKLHINYKANCIELVWSGCHKQSLGEGLDMDSAIARQIPSQLLLSLRDSFVKQLAAKQTLAHKLVVKTEHMLAAWTGHDVVGLQLTKLELSVKPEMFVEIAQQKTSAGRRKPRKWKTVPFSAKHCVLTLGTKRAVSKLREMDAFQTLLDNTPVDYKFDSKKRFSS